MQEIPERTGSMVEPILIADYYPTEEGKIMHIEILQENPFKGYLNYPILF